MAFTDFLLSFIEVFGTVAFAISGASVAIRHRLDLFGVIILGGVTALGGGVFRDILMGCFPPRMFTSFEYLLIAALTSVGVFLVAYFMRNRRDQSFAMLNFGLNFIDALGLGSFVATGTNLPMVNGYAGNAFMCVFLGTVTGVGGGIFRDMMTHDIPVVLRKHIYAVAAIAGSIVYYVLARYLTSYRVAAVACITVTVVLRLLATRYNWNLPRIPSDDEE